VSVNLIVFSGSLSGATTSWTADQDYVLDELVLGGVCAVSKDPAATFPGTEGIVGANYLMLAVNTLGSPIRIIVDQAIFKGEKLFFFSNGSSGNKTITAKISPLFTT